MRLPPPWAPRPDPDEQPPRWVVLVLVAIAVLYLIALFVWFGGVRQRDSSSLVPEPGPWEAHSAVRIVQS